MMHYTVSLLLLLFLAVIQIAVAPPPTTLLHYSLPIRVALTIDAVSQKDVLISMHAVMRSAIDNSTIFFHIVACHKDTTAALELAKRVEVSIQQCFGSNFKNFEVKPFSMPTSSGFYTQMQTSKTKSHWNSATGADMARFFLGQIFPHLDRLLYIDNDIIVSCCLEEVWGSDLTNRAVGIALDDLKWATVTQFQRQYNGSHFLVIKNIRRNATMAEWKEPISEEEFWKALPKYPNDGVLLFNIKKYNELKVYDTINEIAIANSGGEYVVGLGTQQFTVLGMHDRWVEITPRANLRHFPDMARGFLMWFLYNGFIHYAGSSKPRQICQWKGVGNEHRIHTYTPWAISVNELHEACPAETSTEAFECAKHIQRPQTFIEFIRMVSKVMELSKDPELVYLRIGELEGELTRYDYFHALECLHPDFAHRDALFSSNHNYTSHHRRLNKHHHGQQHHHGDLDQPSRLCQTIHFMDRLALHNSSWSGKVFHFNDERLMSSQVVLDRTKYPRDVSKTVTVGKGKSASKSEVNRTWQTHREQFCMYESPIVAGYAHSMHDKHCHSVLQTLKDQGKKHWDIIAITVDLQTPYRRDLFVSPSLLSLRALDLEFMRPKFIVIRLGIDWAFDSKESQIYKTWMDRDVSETIAILRRNGFVVTDNQEKLQDLHGQMVHTYCNDFDERYRCLWGIRVNVLELGWESYY